MSVPENEEMGRKCLNQRRLDVGSDGQIKCRNELLKCKGINAKYITIHYICQKHNEIAYRVIITKLLHNFLYLLLFVATTIFGHISWPSSESYQV